MVDLEEIRRYLTKALGKYRDHSEYEDGFQEGMIRAWKDVEAGNEDFLHVAHRAKQWAFNYLKDVQAGRRHSTGTPRRTRGGRRDAQGEKTREKICNYVQDHVSLHEVEPTNVEISQGTGLSTSVVGYHRKNMREGRRVNYALYSEQYGETRIDFSAYRFSPITDENRDYIFSFNNTTFEDATVENLDFLRILEKVDQPHRNVLYWHHALDYTAKEIAEMLGLRGGSTTGGRRIKFAHQAVLEALYPEDYIAKCSNNHTRTPENTGTRTGSLGQISRYCKDCQDALRVKQAARRKQTKGRVLKTHCKNNHEIRGYKSGRRYCKVCNYISRFPGRTDSDISPESKLWAWDIQK